MRVHWLAAAVAFVLAGLAGWYGWSRIEDRRSKLDTACEYAERLASERLVDQAQRMLAVVRRAEEDRTCWERDAAGLRYLQRERAEAFERARSARRFARVARRHVTRRMRRSWLRQSLEAYQAGLLIDPASPGARSGLRSALRHHRFHGAEAARRHCDRAVDMLVRRLVRETRSEYVRAVAAGSQRSCRAVGKALRAQRREAYVDLRAAESYERAGDLERARETYLAVVALDPGVAEAIEGLLATAPTAPASPDWLALGRAAPAVGAAIAFVLLLVVPVLLVFWYAVVVRLLRQAGAIGPIAELYAGLPWFKWLRRQRVLVTWASRPSALQRRAWEIAKDELEQAAPGDPDAIYVVPAAPTELATAVAGLAGPSADVVKAVPILDRLGAMNRVLRPLAGLPWASTSIEPVADDGFWVEDVVRLGRRPTKPALHVEVDPPSKRDERTLGVHLSESIRDQWNSG